MTITFAQDASQVRERASLDKRVVQCFGILPEREKRFSNQNSICLRAFGGRGNRIQRALPVRLNQKTMSIVRLCDRRKSNIVKESARKINNGV